MKSIQFTIIKKTRRKTISITVKPDKTVRILAPAFCSDSDIIHFAERKKSWILEKLDEFDRSELHLREHRYEEGEVFPFMGKQLTLALQHGRGKVEVAVDTITVEIPRGLSGSDTSGYVEQKLRYWYMTQAKTILRRKTTEYGDLLALTPGFVSIKEYTSRWGCCFSDGRIYFNWKIIMAPERIIDYVIIHELCHLHIPNHSPAYWSCVESILPDWKQCRKWLRLNGHGLHI